MAQRDQPTAEAADKAAWLAKLGPPVNWSEAELVRVSTPTPADLARVRLNWRVSVKGKLKDLLDADPIDR